MKVAIDCSHFLIPGGVRTYIGNFTRALESQLSASDQVTLYFRGLRASPKQLELPDSFARVDIQAPRRLLAQIEAITGQPKLEYWTGPLDAVHATHFAMPATRPSTHRVLTVQDVTYLRHPEFFGDHKLNDYGYKTLLQSALKRSDRILAASHSTMNDLIELCHVDAEKIWVLPHGRDPRVRRPSEERMMRTLESLGIDRPFVFYPVGTLDIRKNIRRSLQAFQRAFPIASERPLLLLSTIGKPDSSIRQLIDELQLSSDVRFVNVSYPDGVACLLSGAEWGIYPSLYEGFGFPVIEAMSCGMPLLCTNRTSCPEIAGDSTLLVDPEDIEALSHGMRELHESASLRQKLESRGLERANSAAFSWQRAARQLWAAYADDANSFAAEPQALNKYVVTT